MNTGLSNSKINLNQSDDYIDAAYEMLISTNQMHLLFSTQQQMRSRFLHQLYTQLNEKVDSRFADQTQKFSKQMKNEYEKLKKIYKLNKKTCDQKMKQIQTDGDMYIQNKRDALTQILKNKYDNQVAKLKADYKEKEMRHLENQAVIANELEQSYHAALKKNTEDITAKYNEKYHQLFQRYQDQVTAVSAENKAIAADYHSKVNALMQYINKLTKQCELANLSLPESDSQSNQFENSTVHNPGAVVLRYPR